MNGNLNTIKCIRLLKDNLLPDLDKSEIFQRNKAPCLRSLAAQQSLSVTALKDRSV